MKLFGMGNVKNMYLYMRDCFSRTQDNERITDIFIDEVRPSGNISPFRSFPKTKEGTLLFNEKVIYLKWPLKPRMFIEMKQCGPDDLELQLKNGQFDGIIKEATKPPEDFDVLTIPEVIQVPVIRPVMQDEKLMNVDIITERGIFIGLGTVEASFYLDKIEVESEGDTAPGYKEVTDKSFTQTKDPIYNNLNDMPNIPIEMGKADNFLKTSKETTYDISTMKNIFEPENIYHSDSNDSEIIEPEKSGVTSGISEDESKDIKKDKKSN